MSLKPSLRTEWEVVPGWEFGPVSGTVAAVLWMLAAAALGHFNNVPWYYPLLAGTAGLAVVAVASSRTRPRRGVTAHRVVCVSAATVWATWSQVTDPFAARPLAAWALGSVVLGGAAVAMGKYDEAVTERREAILAITTSDRTQRAELWKSLIESKCSIKVDEIVAVEPWPATKKCAEPGYTVEVRLGDGAIWEDIAAKARNLASKARLPHGCHLEVSEGNGADLALIRVPIYSGTLKESIPYPLECPVRSANNDYPVGVRRDGTDRPVNTRENSVLIGGKRGAGKTTLIFSFLCRLAEMDDEITVVFDFKGNLADPLVRPYLEGRAKKPAIDWVVRDPTLAIAVCEALIRVGQARAAAPEYARLKRQHNTNLLPVSRTVPQFTLVVDEGKAITGADVVDRELVKLAQLITKIREMYRNEGLNVIFSCLRTIASALGGTDARVQSALLFLLNSKTEEIHNTFENTSGITAASIPHPGNALVALDAERPEAIQTYNTLPREMDHVAVTCGGRHPEPDPISLAALGEIWEHRWDDDQIGWLLDAAGVDTVPVNTDDREDGQTEPASDIGDVMADMEDANNSMLDVLRRIRERDEAEAAGTADDDGVDELKEMFDAEPGEPGPQQMLAVLYEAGPKGMGETELYNALVGAGLRKTRQAFRKWLRAAVDVGKVVQHGDRQPYIHASHAQ